jgi:hypothetical protein
MAPGELETMRQQFLTGLRAYYGSLAAMGG